MTEKESLEKLLLFQQDLQVEKECLEKIIFKLNEQAHALQVEQLHILNAINRNANKEQEVDKTQINRRGANLKEESFDSESQDLDLSVPTFQSSEEDEDEIDD